MVKYFRRIPTHVITIHQRYRQTDRQTDRQTTCDRNTALCTKVHRAVKTLKQPETVLAFAHDETEIKRNSRLSAVLFYFSFISLCAAGFNQGC